MIVVFFFLLFLDKKDARAAKGRKRPPVKLKKRKLKKTGGFVETAEVDSIFLESERNLRILEEHKPTKPDKEKKKHKLATLKKRREQRNDVDARSDDQLPHKDEQCMDQINSCRTVGNDSEAKSNIIDSAGFKEANMGRKNKIKKVKKAGKSKKKDLHVHPEESKLEENRNEIDPAKFDEISSLDEDCSRGMKIPELASKGKER
uniref:Uncharacterized protein LOC105042078 isoform X2 n=1 Tax=Elaeis guineensis var. tenera TaxID=51953 RepID=A0A8N4F220_ELAGV|nr:uncharacterized protein LOC105042078 isoform X2 [Elaeis guineensis]